MKTTRRQIMAGAAAATLATPALFGTARAQARWNLACAYAASNFHTENLVEFAKGAEAATNGRVSIAVHANASLFKAPEIKRAVATGQAQMGEILISNHENEDALFGIDVVPFLATSFAESKRLYRASKEALSRKLAAQNLVLLMAVAWPPQGLYSKTAIKSVEDMKGIKFRAYNVGTSRIAELAGAQPVTIQAAELPQALATGVVTSFISSGSTGYDSKVWESLSFFYDVQAWLPKNVTVINKGVFDALPADQRTALVAAAGIAEARGWTRSEELTNWYLKELAAKGMTVEAPSPALAAGFKKYGETLTADWLRRAGADGQAIVDAYRKLGA